MRLKSRIKKLQESDKNVYIHHKSLITFDGYHADEAASRFWWGAVIFVIVLFILLAVGSWIYTAQRNSSDPEIIRANTEHQKMQDEQDRKDKQQYIDGCKDAGKSPTEMGELRNEWSCR